MKNIKFTTASGIQLSYDDVRDLDVQIVPLYQITVFWDDLSKTAYKMPFTETTSEIPKMLINKNILKFTVEKI